MQEKHLNLRFPRDSTRNSRSVRGSVMLEVVPKPMIPHTRRRTAKYFIAKYIWRVDFTMKASEI